MPDEEEKEVAPEAEDPPVAEEEAPAAEEEAVPQEEAPPMEEDLPPQEEVPPQEEDVVPQEEDDPPDEEIPPEDEAAKDPVEEQAPEEEQVEEHLKDAVEGSFRLKRLLSADDGPAGKKRKVHDVPPGIKEKANRLMTKWKMTDDSSVKHTLENLTEKELQFLISSSYIPPRGDSKRSSSEFVSYEVVKFRERSLPGGAGVDCVSSFAFRWKLSSDQERQLRELSHKDLRYVVLNYDGTSPLEDVISEASHEEPTEDQAIWALPTAPGSATMARFNRLELIDPMADCAVFGDANLSFSLNLAKHRTGLGHVGRVIATTFEEIETLRERYKEIDESIKILEEHDAEVYHGVDCTRIAIDSKFKDMENSLGAVYYNYPHSGAIQGFFDSHPMVNWRHENLMRLFFRALRSFVKPGGFVKVASNKGAVGVRYSYIVGGALENEFIHVETIPFQEWCLHRYGRSYGDRRDVYKRPDAKNNQSYNAQNASNDMVYCFRYEPSGKQLGPQPIRAPPTLDDLQRCKDGPFANMSTTAKFRLAKQLHDRFLTEVNGVHVG